MSNTLTVELPFGIEPEEALLLLSMKLFEEGRVSLGYAAGMAGYTKRTYMELLAKHGVPAFVYEDPDEIEREVEILQQVTRQPQRSASDE